MPAAIVRGARFMWAGPAVGADHTGGGGNNGQGLATSASYNEDVTDKTHRRTPRQRDGGIRAASAILIPIFTGTFHSDTPSMSTSSFDPDRIRRQVRFHAYVPLCRRDSIARFKTAVGNMVRFGNPDGTGTVIEPGLIATQVESRSKTKMTSMRRHPFSAYVTVSTASYTVDAVFKTFTFTGKPILRCQYVGRWASQESEP